MSNSARRKIVEMHTEIDQLRAENSTLKAELAEAKKDAERYRWLRNPNQDVSLVLDKVVSETPVDEFGGGGYKHYEYRAGEDLDAAIDEAMKGK